MSEVRSTIEKYFSNQYLFDSAHELFRALISPPSPDTAEPPFIPISSISRFADVQAALGDVDENERDNSIVKALSDSKMVVTQKDSNGTWMIRRAAFLNEEDDPALRTVVARPIHPESTDDEIRDYFGCFGDVQQISRRKVFANDGAKVKSSANICFVTQAAALACARGKHSFGTLPHALGQRFVPKLLVTLLRDYEEHVNEQVHQEEQQQLQRNIVSAQRDLAARHQQGPTPFAARKFLLPGRTVKCTGIAPSTTWAEIKAKLGNLALSRPLLKGAITLVKIEEALSHPTVQERTAFVVLKSPAAVSELLTTLSVAEGHFFEDIRALCPNILELTSEEDAWVRSKYAEWVNKKAEAKVDENNRKRGRD